MEKNKLNIKYWIFDLIDPTMANDKSSRIFNMAMMILIILNVTTVILETVPSILIKHFWFFVIFDTFSLIIFAIEYILRVWTCTYDPKYKGPFIGRIKFISSPSAIIDLISFLPMLIPVFGMDLRMLRALRLTRLFRILKMNRYTDSLTKFTNVFRKKKEELGITALVGFIVLLIASTLMYYIESPYQPEAFSSIPASMWWGVETLTTVGYGDTYPLTALGKLLGSLISVIGIGLFALPAGILATGFLAEMQKENKQKRVCPHCGKEFEG